MASINGGYGCGGYTLVVVEETRPVVWLHKFGGGGKYGVCMRHVCFFHECCSWCW